MNFQHFLFKTFERLNKFKHILKLTVNSHNSKTINHINFGEIKMSVLSYFSYSKTSHPGRHFLDLSKEKN